MIYFDKDTQEQLVNRFACCLEPGGYLLTGHSESLTGLKHPFQYVSPSVYRSEPRLRVVAMALRATKMNEDAAIGKSTKPVAPASLSPVFVAGR